MTTPRDYSETPEEWAEPFEARPIRPALVIATIIVAVTLATGAVALGNLAVWMLVR